jgi:hypothetical protein
MWNMKYFVVPMIYEDTRIVTTGLKQISGNNTGKAFNTFSTKEEEEEEKQFY